MAIWLDAGFALLAALTDPFWNPNVAFVFHAFPLPYHRSGFTSSQAVRVVVDHLLFSREDGALPEVVAFRKVPHAQSPWIQYPEGGRVQGWESVC